VLAALVGVFICCGGHTAHPARFAAAQGEFDAGAAKPPACKLKIHQQRATLLKPVYRKVGSPSNCSSLCRANDECNAWFWCGEENDSCWDRQTRSDVAAQSCQLLTVSQAPGPVPSKEDAAQPFSNWAAGFLVDTEHRYLKYAAPPRLIMATAVKSCKGPGSEEANRLNWASVAGKLDFAHLHGFELWLHHETGDRDKVEALLGILRAAPLDAWLLWADFDTAFAGRAFVPPLAQYEEEGAHVVLSGQLSEVLAGNGYKADTGTMVLRNTRWTRTLFLKIRRMLDDPNTVAQMTSKLVHYHEEYDGRNDRTALVWLVYQNPDTFLPHVKFETKYCLACFWAGQLPQTSYITHFLMTQKCNQFSLARNDTYNPLFWNHYHASRCTFMEGMQSQDDPLSILKEAQRSAHPDFLPLRAAASPRTPAAEAGDAGIVRVPHVEAGGPQIVGPGFSQRAPSAGHCRGACRKAAYCNMWLYCWHPGGCDDGLAGVHARRRLREGACQLLHLPEDKPYDILQRGPLFSSFSIGFFSAVPQHSHHLKEGKAAGAGERSAEATTSSSGDRDKSSPGSSSNSSGRAERSGDSGGSRGKPRMDGSNSDRSGKNGSSKISRVTAGDAKSTSEKDTEVEEESEPDEVPNVQSLDLPDDPGAWDDAGGSSTRASDGDDATGKSSQNLPSAEAEPDMVQQRLRRLLQERSDLGLLPRGSMRLLMHQLHHSSGASQQQRRPLHVAGSGRQVQVRRKLLQRALIRLGRHPHLAAHRRRLLQSQSLQSQARGSASTALSTFTVEATGAVSQAEDPELEPEDAYNSEDIEDSQDIGKDSERRTERRKYLDGLPGGKSKAAGRSVNREAVAGSESEFVRGDAGPDIEVVLPPNVALLTAVPPSPCKAPLADMLNSLSLANKVQYARIHGYELHCSTTNIEKNATGVFNKEAMIIKMLAESSANEVAWMWWVDIDTLIVNATAGPPLDNYVDQDFVAWGHAETLLKGDMQNGINNGVLMVRNSAWSRKFWGEVSEHATTEGLAAWKPELEEELGPLPSGFFDTPIIVFLLKTRPEYFERVFFERGPVGFNRHWLSVEWDHPPPLVVHYAGCTTCSPPESVISEERVGHCNTEFARAYAMATCLQQQHYLGGDLQCSYYPPE